MLIETLERRGAKAALLQNNRTIEAGSLARDAKALAGALARRKIAEGDRVVLLLPNCKELALALLACGRLGSIAAPLDPAVTSPELGRALQVLAPKCIFLLGRQMRTLEAALGSAGSSPPLVVRIDQDLEGALATDDESLQLESLLEEGSPCPAGPPERAAFLAHMVNRGRGAPHFAVRPADAVLDAAVLAARATGLIDASVETSQPILAAAPFFRPGALELQVVAPLALGISIVVLKQLRAGVALKLARVHGVRSIVGPPALLGLMARIVLGGEPAPEGVRLCVATSAPPPPPAQAEEIERAFQAPLVWGYSPPEAPWALAVREERRTLPPAARGLGDPVGDVTIALVQDGVEGAAGEIHVRSRRAARELLGERAEDRPTPLGVRTGDRAVRLPDGTLKLLQREDVATVAAYEVDLAEVSEALRRHPAVALAHAAAIPDPELGNHVRAVVTLAPGGEASVAELVDFLRGSLAYYKIPHSFRFRRLGRPE